MILQRIYNEVYAILQVLGSEYIDKIPIETYEYILSQKDDNIQIYYDVNKTIEEQEMSKETVMFIAYLNLKYWCSKDEKKELLKIYKQNDEKIEQELKEKYNVNNLFKNKQKQETQLVEKETKNYIKMLIEKIINTICFWKRN